MSTVAAAVPLCSALMHEDSLLLLAISSSNNSPKQEVAPPPLPPSSPTTSTRIPTDDEKIEKLAASTAAQDDGYVRSPQASRKQVQAIVHLAAVVDKDFELFHDKSENLAIPIETADGKVEMEETPMAVGDVVNTISQHEGKTQEQDNKDKNETRTTTLDQHQQQEQTEREKTNSRFVSCKDFDLLKVIGMGSFGKVLQVRNKRTGSILAMKVISKRVLKKKSGYVQNVRAERDILTRVRHEFVVTMHCSFQTREKLFIIMDFLAGGELFLRIGREGIFLEKDAAFYLAEIVLALDHLHTLGILHRDLKPENILLGSDGHICLTDFGLARDFGPGVDVDGNNARALTICGTQEYMAPEMLARQGYGRAADYWSLGCIAYEMLSGLPPFQRKRNEGSKDLFRKIMSEKVKMPTGASAEACKLLKGLLNRNVQARLGTVRSTMFEMGGVASLKSQPFFKNINWEKLAKKEVKPPEILAVDNDHDLKHFHDDFTKMTLPRSVVEMSQSNNHPKRVESDLFRGFSFIQEDFELPARDEQALKAYWEEMAEGDGESVSDVASSKMDDEEGETTQAELDKKKRPTRKRNKKKKADGGETPAGSLTPILSAANTPAPSRTPSAAGDKDNEETASTADDTPAATPAPPGARSASTLSDLTPQEYSLAAANQKSVAPIGPKTLAARLQQQTQASPPVKGSPWKTPTKPPQQQQPARNRGDPWKLASDPASVDKLVNSPSLADKRNINTTPPIQKQPHQLVSSPEFVPQGQWAKVAQASTPHRPQQPAWGTGPRPVGHAVAATSSPAQNLNWATPRGQQQQQSAWGGGQLPGGHSTQPAMWGSSRQPQNNKTQVPSGVAWQQQQQPSDTRGMAPSRPMQQQQAPPPPASYQREVSFGLDPSADWRQHAMSPRSHRPIQQPDGGGGNWPSLDDRPVKAAPPRSPAASAAPPPKLKGAWASRAKV